MTDTANYEKEIREYKRLKTNYGNRYDENVDEIKKLEKECRKLLENKEGLKRTENYLKDYEGTRNLKCNKLKGINDVTFVRKYVASMESINSSGYRKNAYNCITYSKEELDRKINDTLDYIEQLKNENRMYLNKIDDCEHRIQQLKLQKENAEKDN